MSKSRTVRGTQRGDGDQVMRDVARRVVRDAMNKAARRTFKRATAQHA